ncbi:MAG TPA: rRNA maturation RNase YbeY [Candidatus Acidoferrum sp.]|nr:rRNA maturation RNase YbeY [Candidatus Acidoferrum sp.]
MILNLQRTARLARRPLELFLRRVWDELGIEDAEVTVCFVSDAEIARMNEAFRRKKGPTDVLSFPAAEKRKPLRTARGRRGPIQNKYLGDIAISPAMAQRNAKAYGRTPGNEIRILMLHGVLHLLGYDHETDRGAMNRLEQKLRRRLGLV